MSKNDFPKRGAKIMKTTALYNVSAKCMPEEERV
jgi:hypothetical protein